MAEQLADIPPVPDLYDYRAGGAEDCVPLWLPYNQGDVFKGVPLPGAPKKSDDDLAMLFMHPCTMREGVRLAGHVTLVQVRRNEAKKVLRKPKQWKSPKIMPLPDLLADDASNHYADFMTIATVPSSAIPRTARIAQLSNTGRCHMLHRMIYHLTRSAPSIETVEASIQRVQKELELQEEWVTTGAGPRANELREDEVVLYESAYQAYLDELWDMEMPGAEDTIRDRLHSADDAEHADASANVASAIEDGRAVLVDQLI